MPKKERNVPNESREKHMAERIRSYAEQFKPEKRTERILSVYGSDGKIGSDNKLLKFEYSVSKNVNGKRVEGREPVFDPAIAEQYNAITLPVPEGLSKRLVAAVAIGAAFDRKRLAGERIDSSSSVGVDDVEHKRIMLGSNVLDSATDERLRNYGPILLEARKDTVKILEEFSKGNYAPAREALLAVKDNICGNVKLNLSSTFATECEYIFLVEEAMENDKLRLSESMTEIEQITVRSSAEKLRARDLSARQEEELAAMSGDADRQKREQLIAEYLFNKAVANIDVSVIDEMKEKVDRDIQNAYAKHGVFDQMMKVEFELDGNKHLGTGAYLDLSNELRQRKDPYSTELGIPGGREKLKELYFEAIKKTPQFRALAESSGEGLSKAITDCEKFSLSKISAVKIPTENAERFSKPLDDYNSRLEKLDSDIGARKPEVDRKIAAREEKQRQIELKKDMITLLTEELGGLNTGPSFYQKGHKDSDSIVALRQKANSLKELIGKTAPPIMDDPTVRQLAYETYKASAAYISEKRTAAHVSESNQNWEPGSPMGQARYRAAKAIERELRPLVLDIIALEETKKENIAAEKMSGAAVAKEIYDRKFSALSKRVRRDKRRPDGEADPRKDAAFREDLACLIASKLLGKAYELNAEVTGEMPTAEVFEAEITAAGAEIAEREDFRHMVANNSIDRLIELASDGKGGLLLNEMNRSYSHLNQGKQHIMIEINDMKFEPKTNAKNK